MKRLVLVVMLVAPLVGSRAHATTAKALGLKDLVSRAQLIVQGRIVGLKYRYNEKLGMVYTDYTVRVEDVLKGKAKGKISFTVPGGTYKGIVQVVSGTPNFGTGDIVLLFLSKWKDSFSVVGLSHGAFFIDPSSGEVTRRLNRITLVGTQGQFPDSLTTLKARIRELVHESK